VTSLLKTERISDERLAEMIELDKGMVCPSTAPCAVCDSAKALLELQELRLQLTASESRAEAWKRLACEVHITEGNEWLYSTQNEPDWIAERDAILAKEPK
jgi:hypothetical protein